MIEYLELVLNNHLLFVIMLFIFGIVSAFTPCFLGSLPIFLKHISNSNNKIKSTLILIFGVIANLLVMAFIFIQFNNYISLNNDYINLFIGLLLIFIGYDIAFLKKNVACKIIKKNDNPFLFFLNGFMLMFLTSTCISPVLLYILLSVGSTSSALGYFYVLIYALGFSMVILIFQFFSEILAKFRIKYEKIIYYINIILGIIIILFGINNIYLILFM